MSVCISIIIMSNSELVTVYIMLHYTRLRQQPPIEEVIECERNSELVGQLK